MLRPWLTLSGNVLLLLFGVQLGIAAFFLFPSYVEYARDTQHLGVDLHHILVGDPFTNVGAVFCVLYPIPVLCSFGRAHSIRPLGDLLSHSIYSHPVPSLLSPAAIPSPCDCLADALVSQHVFLGQLEFSAVPMERVAEFLASSPVSDAASRFARDGISPEEGSPLYEEVAAMLNRVDAASEAARRAVTRLTIDAEFTFSRARFAHHVAFSGVKIAKFIHDFLSFDTVYTSDATLRRTIEYLVPVTVVSAEAISTDAVIATSALSTLLNAITVDALDTLVRVYSSFLNYHQAISHCAMTSSSSASICAAVEMLLHNVSKVQSMREDLATLKDTVKVCSKDLDGYFICAKAFRWCTLDQAFQILSSSESCFVEWGASTNMSGGL